MTTGWDERALSLLRRLPARIVVLMDDEFVVRWINDYGLHLLGVPLDDVVGASAVAFVHPEDLETVAEEQARVVDEAAADLLDEMADRDTLGSIRIRRGDGTWVRVAWRLLNFLADDPAPFLALEGRVAQDATGIEVAIEHLGEAAPLEAVLHALGRHLCSTLRAPDAALVVRRHGRTAVYGADAPPPALDLDVDPELGAAHPLAAGGALRVVPTAAGTYAVRDITIPGSGAHVGAVVARVNGRVSLGVKEVLATVARLAGVTVSIHEQTERLEAAARTDPLTGVANRRALDDWVGRDGTGAALGTSAVVAVDLDGFKDVNDRFGHGAGDDVLVAVANRLRAVASPTDLVARVGGDEFVVCTTATATVLELEDLVARVERELAAASCGVGASVGGALQRAGEPLSETLRRADLACYAAKHRRRIGDVAAAR